MAADELGEGLSTEHPAHAPGVRVHGQAACVAGGDDFRHRPLVEPHISLAVRVEYCVQAGVHESVQVSLDVRQVADAEVTRAVLHTQAPPSDVGTRSCSGREPPRHALIVWTTAT